MTMIKKLPLTMAVIAAFFPLTSVMAQEFTQEQIDAIVAKAVDKALADRQAKIDAAANKKVDVITNPETTAASPDMAIPFGLKFSGYARYGAHFQTGDQKYVGVDGSYNGASAIGRLGNESNGGEFQISKAFKSAQGAIWDLNVMFDHWSDEVNLKKAYVGVTNVLESNPNAYIWAGGGEFQISKAFKSAQGAIWDLNVMFDHWSDEVNLKKAYVGVTNVLESNPNAYLWAGRDFHQRPQQGINDYFWMNHDGQGAGVKNFDIGGVQFDVAAVSQVKSCSPEVMADETNPSRITCTGSSDTGDNGHYALTTKTHNIKAGPIDVEVYANYGFDSKAVDSDARLEAWQGGLVLSHTNDSGVNKVILRYSDNSDNSVYNKTDDLTTVYASFEGSHKFTQQAQVEYLLAFHDYDNGKDNTDNRKNYGAIVRPMYFWNDVHSTWLEAGYQRVDYDQGGDNHGWKLTLSQN
ncbi:carbohydrate porin, partial [Klebsiella pneumoniae]|uniref:carbohydrate porin n=1 Tax=Klebsiella pneumoniae TaxID=573 RepID=UPI003D6AA7F6